MLVAGRDAQAGKIYGAWTCNYQGFSACNNVTERPNLESVEDAIRLSGRPDMVSMALAHPVGNQWGANAGARTKLAYNRGGTLTGHGRTRPYSLLNFGLYAMDDGQNRNYPSITGLPSCGGSFGNYCATPVAEVDRLNSSSYGSYLCWNGSCYRRSPTNTNWTMAVGGTNFVGPAHAVRAGNGLPPGVTAPGGRIGGYVVEASEVQKVRVEFEGRVTRNGVPVSSIPACVLNPQGGLPSPCAAPYEVISPVGGPNSFCQQDPFNSVRVICEFPMQRYQWMICNIGFRPAGSGFQAQPDLTPPHSLAYEQELPCTSVANVGTDADKADAKAIKGIPALSVGGSDPSAPATHCQGNPCVPGTGEKLVPETDFEFSGYSFGRTYRSLRKGRSYGFIDDNWTHSWSSRILTNKLGVFTANNKVVVSTATGDLEVYVISDTAQVLRNTSRVGVVMKVLNNSTAMWQILEENSDYQNFGADGRLLSIGNLNDPARKLSFTYLLNVDTNDWSWWAIKTATDARGRQLTFEYDINKTYQPRLLRILLGSDPATPTLVQYRYWEEADVTQVFWRLKQAEYPDGRVRRYTYADQEITGPNRQKHYLTGIELGSAATIDTTSKIRFATYAYDNFGRVIDSHHGNPGTHAGRVQLNYLGNEDSAPSTVAVTQPLGSVRTFTFPALGATANLNGLNLPSSRADNAGTTAYTYIATSGGKCSAGPIDDWRKCTVTDGRGFITLYEYASAYLVRVTEGLIAGAKPNTFTTTPETRSTVRDWNQALGLPTASRVCAGQPTTCTNSSPGLQSAQAWAYDTFGKLTARCEYDTTVATATNYSCGSTAVPPISVRKTTFSYCIGSNTCPSGHMYQIDGPRPTDVPDTTTYSYFPSTNESGCGTTAGPCQRAGDLNSVTNGLGHASTIDTYDRRGRPVRMSDANGVYTEFSYDAQGRLTSRRILGVPGSPADAVTTITYRPDSGMVNHVTMPDGDLLQYGYDTALRLTSIIDNLGNNKVLKLNAAGNVLVDKILEGSMLRRRIAQEYDVLGRLIRQRDALTSAGVPLTGTNADEESLGRLVIAGQLYDENSNRLKSTDGLLRDSDQEFDPLNRLKKSLDTLRPDCTVAEPNCGRTNTPTMRATICCRCLIQKV